jgi:dienelactone hydrolase
MTASEWRNRKRFLKKQLTQLMGGMPNRRTPLNAETVEVVEEGSLICEKVIYETEPGESVPAYVLIPKNRKGPTPAVFCHHQHGGEFNNGKREVIGWGGDPQQAYARELAERGYVAFAPDAKCFEERIVVGLEGVDNERFEATRLLLMGQSLQRRMLWDIRRGIDYLLTRKEVDGDRIGCIGHSLGGQETLFGAAFDTRIKAAVSSCGFSTYKAILRNKINHNLSLYIPGILQYTDIPEIAAMVAPRPFLILAGDKDDIFPLEGIREVYAKAEEVYRGYGRADRVKLVLYDGGHAFTTEMQQEAYRWFDKWLLGKK